MAPWIVHLQIAEGLLQAIPDLDAACFLIGNIAPDSGFRNNIDEEFEPPPRVSHFHAPEGFDYQLADLDFFRNYLAPVSSEGLRGQEFSFLLGYYFHLVTDILWFEEIDKPTRAKFHKEFKADPEFIWEVKRDWYGLDLDFVRKNPKSLFWTVLLGAEYIYDYLPFLPPHAIQRRVGEIKVLYQRTDDDIEEWYGRRPNKYLSKQEYDLFVADITPRLKRTYEVLLIEKIPITDRLSVLEMGI